MDTYINDQNCLDLEEEIEFLFYSEPGSAEARRYQELVLQVRRETTGPTLLFPFENCISPSARD